MKMEQTMSLFQETRAESETDSNGEVVFKELVVGDKIKVD